MKRIDYIERYEFATKTQYIIEKGQIVRETKFKQCPYVFFDKLIEPVLVEFRKSRMDV